MHKTGYVIWNRYDSPSISYLVSLTFSTCIFHFPSVAHDGSLQALALQPHSNQQKRGMEEGECMCLPFKGKTQSCTHTSTDILFARITEPQLPMEPQQVILK